MPFTAIHFECKTAVSLLPHNMYSQQCFSSPIDRAAHGVLGLHHPPCDVAASSFPLPAIVEEDREREKGRVPSSRRFTMKRILAGGVMRRQCVIQCAHTRIEIKGQICFISLFSSCTFAQIS